jgi:hypothetical protein
MSYNRNPGRERGQQNGNRSPRQAADRPRMEDEILDTRSFEAGTKTITITHRRNARGAFLRVDERRGADRGGVVIIPIEAVAEFMDHLIGMFPA